MNSRNVASGVDPEDSLELYEAWLLEGLSPAERQSSSAKLHKPNHLRAFDLLKELPHFSPCTFDPLPTFEQVLEQCRQRRIPNGKLLRVLLIVPPNQTDISPVGNASCYQPEGIWRIGSYVSSTVPGVEVKLVDGTVQNVGDIERVITDWKPDLVGVSVLTPTIGPAKTLSAFAKANGAIVVWGNDHASQNVLDTLMGRDYVDVVIRGDSAPEPFAQLVKVILGEERIDNIACASWREEGGIRTTPMVESWLGETRLPDPSLISNFDVYARNFNRSDMYRHWHDHYVVPAVTNFARGCHWGATRCIYCDIVDLRLRRMGPHRVWEWVDMLHQRYGVNLIYEVCDNFTSFAIPDHDIFKRFGIKVAQHPSYLDRLLETRPAHLKDIEWFVYGRADDFVRHPEMARKLKELGVVRVNMGLDHADDQLLNRALRKGNGAGAETNWQAVRLLAENGIQGYFSIVVGAPGETRESLTKVREFVQWATDTMNGLIVCWDPSILLPLKGSPIWDLLTNPQIGDRYFKSLGVNMPPSAYDFFLEKYNDFDNVDTQEIIREAMKFYCPGVTYEETQDLVFWIYDLCRERGIVPGGFGVRGLVTGIGTSLTAPADGAPGD